MRWHFLGNYALVHVNVYIYSIKWWRIMKKNIPAKCTTKVEDLIFSRASNMYKRICSLIIPSTVFLHSLMLTCLTLILYVHDIIILPFSFRWLHFFRTKYLNLPQFYLVIWIFNDIILSNDVETIIIRLLLISWHVWFGFLKTVSITLLLAPDLQLLKIFS